MRLELAMNGKPREGLPFEAACIRIPRQAFQSLNSKKCTKSKPKAVEMTPEILFGWMHLETPPGLSDARSEALKLQSAPTAQERFDAATTSWHEIQPMPIESEWGVAVTMLR